MTLADELGIQSLSDNDLIRYIAEQVYALRLTVSKLERNIMSDFDQIMAELQAQGTMMTELATVVASVHDHVEAQHTGAIVSPATQAKIDSAMSAVTSNREKLLALLEKAKGTVTMTEPQQQRPLGLNPKTGLPWETTVAEPESDAAHPTTDVL